MAESPLSYTSSESFRKVLIARNLKPYTVPGVYTSPKGPVTHEEILSNYSVKDSDGTLISEDKFADKMYPLNQYGPEGGYNKNITYNNLATTTKSNEGPYNPNDTKLDLVNEFFIDAAFIENRYGPVGGYNSMYYVSDIQNNNKIYSPYWQPPTFVPSKYSPYSIIISNNPAGSDGLLSQDSYLAKLGAETLKKQFQERIASNIYKNTVGVVNLDALSDPFEATLVATGQEPFIYKNYRITIPENPLVAGGELLTRLSGTYFPVSTIPGDYFQTSQVGFGIYSDNQKSAQSVPGLNIANNLLGGLLGPILNTRRNPSEIFLANTGSGQKSVLFANLNHNLYSPIYDRGRGKLSGAIVNIADTLIAPNGTLKGSYYVGNVNADPAFITSPNTDIPSNQFGQKVFTPVYGPSELGKLFEGNENRLLFGLGGYSSSDSGGMIGQFMWVTRKTEGALGRRATAKGGFDNNLGTQDPTYNVIKNQFTQSTLSDQITFKGGSILDNTQRLIDAADRVNGVKKLQHVGNAINQVSKVFHDGYKKITKGSQVVSYKDNANGQEAGIEYKRVFTKDTPYLTYDDLQKTDGITTSGRRFSYSVLDNTYNLNIAPIKGLGSTNIVNNRVKKYMFSIENLAWRTSNRAGLRVSDLPASEQGPNGGRIMWFPPYDIKFTDTSSSSFQGTSFLGRPEPMYTYKDSTRSGTLSWKMIVDHPSIINTIVKKQLANVSDERINSIVDSFFAGCVKYDIYELAKKFNTIPFNKLQVLQEKILKMTPEEYALMNSEIQKQNDGTETNAQTNQNTSINLSQYNGVRLYFDNNVSDVNYSAAYSQYSGKTQEYLNNSTPSVYYIDPITKQQESFISLNIPTFFNTEIIPGYNKSIELIGELYNILSQKQGNVIVNLEGSSSAVGTEAYNKSVSTSRVESVKKFLLNYPINSSGQTLNQFAEQGTGTLSFKTSSLGENAYISTSSGGNFNCNAEIISSDGPSGKNSTIYSIPAMACRSVKINLTVTPVVSPSTTDTNVTTKPKSDINIKPNTIKPTTTTTIEQKIKEGISKEVVRNLFSEGDYFELIQKENPMVYTTFKEKIKYFNPAFHSMTPEGLNARLTFLNQCVRPGDTIPSINATDNSIRTTDAVNTSFGTPPVLILRVGDFYNTKIIPDSVQFSYEPLVFDLNPEGIGVQPMIVNVSMSFKMIGGMGLAGPVEQLQNALSFNYYANTEIYDERATWTDDSFKQLDKQIVNAIQNNQPNPVNNAIQSNDGGKTIGNVATTTPIENGVTGTTLFGSFMDGLITSSQSYFTSVPNLADNIIKNYNLGIFQLMCKERNYKTGQVANESKTNIFGKSEGIEDNINSLFDKVITDIDTSVNPIISQLNSFNYKPTTVRAIRYNLGSFIYELKNNFNLNMNNFLQEFVISEQNTIKQLQQLNFVYSSYDGKVNQQGTALLYQLTGTDENGTNTITQLQQDGDILAKKYNDYSTLLVTNNIVTDGYDTTNIKFTPLTNVFTSDVDNRFYMVIYQSLKDSVKVTNFINKIVTNEVIALSKSNKDNRNILQDFTNIINNLVSKYNDEFNSETKLITDFKNGTEYTNYTKKDPYQKGLTRTCTYTSVKGTDAKQKELVNIYSSVNSNNDKAVFDGKVKLN